MDIPYAVQQWPLEAVVAIVAGNLRHMNKCLLLVRNLIQQGDAPEEVLECLDSISELMAETLVALDNHEI